MTTVDRLARIDKEAATPTAAGIEAGANVLIGGLGDADVPFHLIHALGEADVDDLIVVANNAGSGVVGVAALFRAGLLQRIDCSFPRSTRSVWFERRNEEAGVELQVLPQGTPTERIRAARAGNSAFFTPTEADTALARARSGESSADRRVCWKRRSVATWRSSGVSGRTVGRRHVPRRRSQMWSDDW